LTDTFSPSNSIQIINSGTKVKEGDTKTVFQIQLLDINSQPVDLTGTTAIVYFSRLSDGLLLLQKSATVDASGLVSFHFDTNDMTGNGKIRLQINIKYSDDSVEKFPAEDYGYIYIDPSLDNLGNVTLSSYTLQQIIDMLTTSFTSSINTTKDELTGNINTVQTNLTNHQNRKDNPHVVTKSQVGLGNADNTSDVNKPVSTAQQTALNAKVDDTEVSTTATANKLLKLDSNGKLPTSITGSADGNAATATKLATARTISASGDVTSTATSFDGSSNITLPLTLSSSGVTAGTYKSVTVDTKGRVTSGTNPTTLSGYGITDSVNSSDIVTTPTPSKILKLDANSKLPTSITGNADGNSATTTKLQTARTIAVSGDATGTATSFDGSANITIPLTLSTSGVSTGTYKSVTVDSKGRVTNGTNPTTLSGYGITDALLSSSYTASDILTKIKTVDGSGSGLDADTVDGKDSSVLVTKYTTQIGDGSATSYVITHNLNTQNCFVSVRSVASPYGTVTPNTIQMTTVNTITITFASAPTTNQYQVTVIG
jgi:phage-related tail fiber protein